MKLHTNDSVSQQSNLRQNVFPKWVALLIFFPLLSFFAPGCQKAPMNGDLDGMWNIVKVTPEPAEEIITQKLYISFYMHVCQLSYPTGGGWMTGNMRYEGNTLSLDFPYAIGNETAEVMLRQYGINSNPATFTIESLSKEKMVIRDGETVVELRKF
ncbi:MAG: lipocalin-like domain-containing protein [Muribaculaceae bacterium]|nr:lipocalin-like domain-containing protein [Muribaculaceae bacterium]